MSPSDARPRFLRLRAYRGRLLLLWEPPRRASRGVRLLAVVVGCRVPYLRCLTVHHGYDARPEPPCPPLTTAHVAVRATIYPPTAA